jgi:uncharacterized membrane protein YphA (DoxX/SURF4 family)
VKPPFFSFARGAPGIGLLIARIVFGVDLIVQAVTVTRQGNFTAHAFLHAASVGGGILLFLGLWTRTAAVIVALGALLYFFFHQADWWQCILFGTFGITLAVLGPGAWSLDARLAGWRRVEIPRR